MTMYGIRAGPNTAMSTPKNTTDIAKALSTSFCQCHGLLPSRRIRCASSSHDERKLPHTLRGRNSQNVSPNRADAGSSGVATRTWCPRLCQRDLAQPAFQRVLLVAELVRSVDAHPSEHPDRQREADLGRPAQGPV